MTDAVNSGWYDQETLDKELETSIEHLKYLHKQLSQTLQKQEQCEHTFDRGSHTIRMNVLGDPYTVHERKCKNCRYIERFTDDESTKKGDLPDWCKETRHAYYNNFL